MLRPITQKGKESMNTNRDAMHAAGGAVFAGQAAAERAQSEQPRKRAPRQHVATLTQAENYKLVAWLHKRTPVFGETVQDILNESGGLGIERLNREHIRNRLAEHADTLPVAKQPVTPETRIDRLERMLAMHLLGMRSGTFTPEVSAELVNFRREILGE